MPRLQLRLALGITLLALTVVVLGAYTRLTGSGLGCPDWPGCYGHLSVPSQAPGAAQAWVEMVHRYAAGSLALLIGLQAWLSWRHQGWRRPAPLLLLAMVALQALLGMWTVTLKVWPQVVTLHLLGGLTTLGLAYWHHCRLREAQAPVSVTPSRRIKLLAMAGLLALALQIALGGWVSTNQAGAVCPTFPGCSAVELNDLGLSVAAPLAQPIGPSYLAGRLGLPERVAIQVLHRLGALILLGLTLILAHRLHQRGFRREAGAILAMTFAQLGLGILSAALLAPLALSLAHTGGAAVLTLLWVNLYHRLCAPASLSGRAPAHPGWALRPRPLRTPS